MAAGYVIAQLKVTNPENYKEYVAKVSEVVKKYKITKIEGSNFIIKGI